MYSLRCLPQPLSSLWQHWRARLWLGLSRADGVGVDPGADRYGRSWPFAQCIKFLRPLRRGMSNAHSAAENDAPSARERV